MGIDVYRCRMLKKHWLRHVVPKQKRTTRACPCACRSQEHDAAVGAENGNRVPASRETMAPRVRPRAFSAASPTETHHPAERGSTCLPFWQRRQRATQLESNSAAFRRPVCVRCCVDSGTGGAGRHPAAWTESSMDDAVCADDARRTAAWPIKGPSVVARPAGSRPVMGAACCASGEAGRRKRSPSAAGPIPRLEADCSKRTQDA